MNRQKTTESTEDTEARKRALFFSFSLGALSVLGG
jgi:hypothetical protein